VEAARSFRRAVEALADLRAEVVLVARLRTSRRSSRRPANPLRRIIRIRRRCRSPRPGRWCWWDSAWSAGASVMRRALSWPQP